MERCDRRNEKQAIECWALAHENGFNHWRLYWYLAVALKESGKEAEALKAEYEQKVASASKHAEELKAGAEDEARLIVEKAKEDAAALVARRTTYSRRRCA